MDLPKTADIVIIGGGVMGASIAYHLAVRGAKNIILLEKEQFFGQGALDAAPVVFVINFQLK